MSTYPVRVYYDDTDAGGVMYYANYLKYAERARTEWLRQLGYTNPGLRTECGILIVVKRAEIDYKKTSTLDDSLLIESVVTDRGATSLTMDQTFTRAGNVICVVRVVLVCVSDATMRPVRWPDFLIKAFGTDF